MNAEHLARTGTGAAGVGRRRGWFFGGCLVAALLSCLAAWAYPPSPYHLIYGQVRDEYGMPLNNDQVKILVVTPSGIQNSTSLQPGLAVGLNYMLPVPMDTLLKPDLYRTNALTVGAGFRMYVVIGNVTNIPIVSTSTSTNLGQPTKLTRIDLVLGTDSNGDGIPDAWELAFLATIGSNLSLSDLNASLDLLHDGRTLMQEYLLGAAVFDPGDPFAVRIVGPKSSSPTLEFPTVTGRTYAVLGSTNLLQWAVLPFRLAADGGSGLTRTNFTASAIQTIQLQVIQSGPAPRAEFFRIGLQ